MNTNEIEANSITTSQIECPICLEVINDTNVIIMNCCKQKIHTTCLNKWVLFKKDNHCILCRGDNDIITGDNIPEREIINDIESHDNIVIQQALLNEQYYNRRTRIYVNVYRNNCQYCLNIFCAFILLIIIVIIITNNNN